MRPLIALLGLLWLMAASAVDLSAFSNTQLAGGLKDSLRQGAVAAVSELGRPDGFLGNPEVRIPLPGPLAQGQALLRMVGMGGQADALVTAMNRAAEAAVPEARDLLVKAVEQMSVQDAKSLLTGGDDAVTRYFRDKTEATLRARFLPVVKRTTDRVGLAQQYNALAGRVSATGLLQGDERSVEDYVTRQALDGLYTMMAEEERKIRENPLEAGSSLARKVFSGLQR